MCRHLCYLGEPITLAELVLDPPHSLVVQSYAPRDMRGGGRVNADGFGAGWFAAADRAEPRRAEPRRAEPGRTEPGRTGAGGAARYRRAGPIWQDAGFRELAARTSAGAVLAAVRNATLGMPIIDTAAAPFTDGRWLFSLNGRIDGWPDTAVKLAGELPGRDLLTLDAPTDAGLLWALLRHRLTAEAADPAQLVAELVGQVLADAPESRLNLLLTDGERCYASTVTHALWWHYTDRATVLASEPYDDQPGWQPIGDGQLVTASRAGVTVTDLPGY